MKFAREVWNPTELWASFSFLSPAMIADSSWAAGDRLLRPPIGWITYLPANLASRAKYPADVEVETLNDGSVLVTLCEEPFEKDDAEGMARLRLAIDTFWSNELDDLVAAKPAPAEENADDDREDGSGPTRT